MKNILLCISAIIILFVIAFLCAVIVSQTGIIRIIAIVYTTIISIIWILLILHIAVKIKNKQ